MSISIFFRNKAEEKLRELEDNISSSRQNNDKRVEELEQLNVVQEEQIKEINASVSCLAYKHRLIRRLMLNFIHPLFKMRKIIMIHDGDCISITFEVLLWSLHALWLCRCISIRPWFTALHIILCALTLLKPFNGFLFCSWAGCCYSQMIFLFVFFILYLTHAMFAILWPFPTFPTSKCLIFFAVKMFCFKAVSWKLIQLLQNEHSLNYI